MTEERFILNPEPYSDEMNAHMEVRGDTIKIELTYPNLPNKALRYVFFDQESVRATDGIRLSFDYERNGYKIEQASRFKWHMQDKVLDPNWQEVAFVEAWSRAETEEENHAWWEAFEAALPEPAKPNLKRKKLPRSKRNTT